MAFEFQTRVARLSLHILARLKLSGVTCVYPKREPRPVHRQHPSDMPVLLNNVV